MIVGLRSLLKKPRLISIPRLWGLTPLRMMVEFEYINLKGLHKAISLFLRSEGEWLKVSNATSLLQLIRFLKSGYLGMKSSRLKHVGSSFKTQFGPATRPCFLSDGKRA